MSLLAPVLLVGLLGLALPLAAHLLGREPPRTIRFAAVRFLPVTEQSVTHRRSLRDWPLLVIRLLLLALLVLALTRPVSVDRAGASVIAEPHDAVLLVDGSRSMELVVDDEMVLEHARDRALGLLRSLPPGTRVGLVTSDPAGPRIEPTAATDRIASALEGWVDSGAPRKGAWPLREGVPLAAGLLEGMDGERKRIIYAVGDATAGGLGSLPATAEGGIPVFPIPALDPDQAIPEHVAIESVGWEPAPELDPRAVRIHAVLRRHALWPAPDDEPGPRDIPLVLRIGDLEVARTTVSLRLDDPTGVEFTHTVLEEGQAIPATVALDLDHDPMPSDDRRHLWLSVDEALEVVVVNGDPSELRAHDEVFFLGTAIAAADEVGEFRLRSMAPDQLEQAIRERGTAALAGVDVLVLANVRAPSEDVSPAIVEQVRRGMGLWVTVGDRVDADAYNARLGSLLPLRMREAVQVGTAPGRAEARVEGIAPADLSHPAFRGLGGDLGLSGTRARKIVLLEPDPSRTVQTALSFTSGAPALLTSQAGQGRVALLTTTIDRDWADLPLRPGFVPMVTRVIRHLGGSRGGFDGSRVLVGEPRKLAMDSGVVVTTPGGREVSVPVEDDGTSIFRDTFVPGHYRARAADGDVETCFAVEVDPDESDPRRVEGAEPELDSERKRVAVSIPRWRPLVLLAALLLALESLLRWRGGGGEGRPRRAR